MKLTLQNLREEAADRRKLLHPSSLLLVDAGVNLLNDLVLCNHSAWKSGQVPTNLHCDDATGYQNTEPERVAALQGHHQRRFLWGVQWAGLSMPMFTIPHSACAAFMNTELRGIQVSDLRFPYDAMLFTLPHPQPLLQVKNSFTGSLETIRWLLVHHTTEVSDSDREAFRQSTPADKRGFSVPETLRLVKAMEGRDHLNIFGVSEEGRFLDISMSGYLEGKEKRIERTGGATEDHDLSSLYMRRIVAAALLYMQSVQQTQSAKNAKDRSNAPLGVPNGVAIGREIKISPALLAATRNMSSGSRAGWRLRNRFITKGHSKMQPCGKGNLERKRIWRMPYWKGPEGAAELARIYSIENEPPNKPRTPKSKK